MKLAVTNTEEIRELMAICNEVEDLKDKLDMYDLEDVEIEEEYSPRLHKIFKDADDNRDILYGISNLFNGVHFQRILWNCDVLLENCADPNSDHVDFKPDIKKGFQLLETQEAIELMTNPDLFD